MWRVYSLPEALGTRPGVETHPDATQPKPQDELFRPAPQPAVRPTRWTAAERTRAALAQLRWPLTVYLTSRLIYLLISVGDVLYTGWSVPAQATTWHVAWCAAPPNTGDP